MRSLTFFAKRHNGPAPVAVCQLTDRLHEGRTVRVPVNAIVSTLSAWLAELGASSPLVDDLARAVRDCDWPTVHAVAEDLAVDVTVTA